MLQKKSVFDILMKKTKPQPKNDENSKDKTIIILDDSLNKSTNENDCIWVNEKSSTSTIKVFNENVPCENSKCVRKNDSPLKFKRKSSSKKFEKIQESYSLDHFRQYSEQDIQFLKELSTNQLKVLFKNKNIDFNPSLVDLKKTLDFDFSDKLKEINQCECKNEDWDKLSQEITFSLNNSINYLTPNKNDVNLLIETKLNMFELEKCKLNLIKQDKPYNVDDTINDADLSADNTFLSNSSSPRRSIENRYGKRQKIDDIVNQQQDIKAQLENVTQNNHINNPSENENQVKKRGRPKKQDNIKISNLDIHTVDENANLEPINESDCVIMIKNEDEISGKSNSSIKKIDLQELWTEKYQFKNEDDIVTNNSQLERLKEWLNNWKTILSKDNSTTNNKSTKSYDSDSDFTYDSDTNSNSENAYSKLTNGKKFYSNAILLSGPHGCGKTSSVHSIAKQLNFKVFEVNSSSLRCKSQIIQDLEGALNSHHVSNNSTGTINFSSTNKIPSSNLLINNKTKTEEPPKSKSLESFFKLSSNPKSNTGTSKQVDKKPGKKRKNSLRKETVLSVHKNNKKNDTENEKNICETPVKTIITINEATTVNIHKESLILFDEIDVVFKEDVGFWAAINHFIKRSKKPIILTTNDEFLQEKINLNIEKIEFIRPRIDASVRFLKSVACKENIDIDTHMAYKIIRECKCDMRRALVQLQVLLQKSTTCSQIDNNHKSNNSLSTLDINRILSKSISNKNCKYHNEEAYFSNIWFLDLLTRMLRHDHNHLNTDTHSTFKKYDLFILRDGLTDNTPTNSSTSSSNINGSSGPTVTNVSAYNFNPFIPQSTQLKIDTSSSKSNALFAREQIFNLFDSFMQLFNDNKMIDFVEWSKHGQINQFNYPCNVSINRFAQALFKFTSNQSISLDYRPYLQQICNFEKIKQHNFTGRRRYNHYLTYLNIGLTKDDYSLLAKSTLVDEKQTDPVNTNNNSNHNEEEICLSQQAIINADLFTLV